VRTRAFEEGGIPSWGGGLRGREFLEKEVGSHVPPKRTRQEMVLSNGGWVMGTDTDSQGDWKVSPTVRVQVCCLGLEQG
jgi:hypothetical protein